MKKFLIIVKMFWQRGLTYRFTVIGFRIGEIGETLILILMWSAIYGGQETVKGFSLREMITYILVGNLFSVMVRNFLSDIISHDIKDGRLSMYLIRPMSYFTYLFYREIGRLSFSTGVSVFSQAFVIIFFLNKFIWNFDAAYLALVAVMIFLAFIIEFLLACLVGFIAFWTNEVDGLYRTVERIKKFFSGGYFPLNLLPVYFLNISFFLPFAYSFFMPAQLYLKKIDLTTGLKGIVVQIVWIITLSGIVKIVWKRGLIKYEGVGI